LAASIRVWISPSSASCSTRRNSFASVRLTGAVIQISNVLLPSPLGGEGGRRRRSDEGKGSTDDRLTESAPPRPPHPSRCASHLLPRRGEGSPSSPLRSRELHQLDRIEVLHPAADTLGRVEQ